MLCGHVNAGHLPLLLLFKESLATLSSVMLAVPSGCFGALDLTTCNGAAYILDTNTAIAGILQARDDIQHSTCPRKVLEVSHRILHNPHSYCPACPVCIRHYVCTYRLCVCQGSNSRQSQETRQPKRWVFVISEAPSVPCRIVWAVETDISPPIYRRVGRGGRTGRSSSERSLRAIVDSEYSPVNSPVKPQRSKWGYAKAEYRPVR